MSSHRWTAADEQLQMDSCRWTATDKQLQTNSHRQTSADEQPLLHLLLKQNSWINWLIISQMNSHRQTVIVAFVIGVEQFDQFINCFINVLLKVASFIKTFSKDWLYEDIIFSVWLIADCLISERINTFSFIGDCCLLGGHSVPVLLNHNLSNYGNCHSFQSRF